MNATKDNAFHMWNYCLSEERRGEVRELLECAKDTDSNTLLTKYVSELVKAMNKNFKQHAQIIPKCTKTPKETPEVKENWNSYYTRFTNFQGMPRP